MKYIGAHVSAAGGVQYAPQRAFEIGATAFAFFTKNQRQWQAKPLLPEEILAFQQNCAKFDYSLRHILPHDSYLVNLSHPDASALAKSRAAFIQEMQRCEQLGLCYLNFHPGSHLGKLAEYESIKVIAQSINLALQQTENMIAIIETTAGQGFHLGYTFNQISDIIANVQQQDRIGVCVDTAHIFAAGYDFRTPETLKSMLQEFDQTIGLNFLKAMHVNDSLKRLASRVDRHANLGDGEIGLPAFQMLMQDERLDEVLFILETPNSELWPQEIEFLKKYSNNLAI